jgi:hypothetical protein
MREDSVFSFASCFIYATPLIYRLQTKVSSKLAALKGLDARLTEIQGYLDLVIDAKLPLNHEILYHLQVHLSCDFLCFMLFSYSELLYLINYLARV